MANVTITASNVVPPTTSTTKHLSIQPIMVAGAAIAAGEVVCQLAADSKLYLADANDADKRDVKGFAGNSAAGAGQRVDVIYESPLLAVGTHGVALGTPLFLSNTPGKICPLADLTSGSLAVQVATVATTTALAVSIVEATVPIA